ncbi:MAG: hypothetical protein ABH857_04950 [Elusimicrobiota bacterium]
MLQKPNKKIKFGALFFGLCLCIHGNVFSDNEIKEKALKISTHLGRIEDSHYAGNDSPLVFVIRNVPCNPEVQSNIEKILFTLQSYYKDKIKIIGVEGDIGYVNTDLITDIPNSALRNAVANELIKSTYLTGAEAFSAISNPNVSLYGLEDWQQYTENMAHLKKGVLKDNNWRQEYSRLQLWLSKEKMKHFNKNLKLAEYYENEYKRGKISLAQFFVEIGNLDKGIKDKNAAITRYPNIKQYIKNQNLTQGLDLQKADEERKLIISSLKLYITQEEYAELLRKQNDEQELDAMLINILKEKNISIKEKFPEIDKYFVYKTAMNTIDGYGLNNEIQEYKYGLKMDLAKTSYEKELVYIDRYAEDINEYISNNASRAMYDDFKTQQIKIINLLQAHYKGSIVKIKEKLDIMGEFYKLAVERSEALVGTLFKYNSDARVIVAGGFYTEDLKTILRNKGASYIVISPQMTHVSDSKKTYLSRLYGKAMNYHVPVISSCIYTKTFREEAAKALLRQAELLYEQKQIDDYALTTVLPYLARRALENNMEKDIISAIYDLVRQGYRAQQTASKKTKKMIAVEICKSLELEPVLIASTIQ